MSAVVTTMLRTAVQGGWAWAVGHWAVLGLIPGNVAVDFLVSVVIIGAITGGLRWLETRRGDSFWPSLARSLGRLLMLGLSRAQPVYPVAPPAGGSPATLVHYDSGQTRTTLR